MRTFKMSFSILICAVIATSLSGCQTDNVDPKDARDTAVLLSGQTLKTPPRSVDGILERLRERSPKLLSELASLRELAASPVTAGLKGSKRARALAERAEAASRLGQAGTAIEIWQEVMTESANLRGSVGYLDRSDWAWRYGYALDVGGHVGESIAQLIEALGIVKAGRPGTDYYLQGRTHGRVAVYEALLAARQLDLGNVEEAKAALSRSNSARAQFGSIVDLGRTYGVTFPDTLLVEIEMADAVTKSGAAELSRIEGELFKAERLFREARGGLREESQAVGGFAANAQRIIWQHITSRLAMTLRDQGRFVEAESEARGALDDAIRTQGPVGLETVRVLLTLNDILLARRRFDDTLQLLSTALPSLDKATDGQVSRVSFQANQQLAVSLAGTGKWDDAAATYRKLEQTIADASDTLGTLLTSDPARAVIYLRAGLNADALRAAHAEAIWARSVYGPDHYNTAESRGLEAAVLWSSGNTTEARAALDEIVPALLQARAGQHLNIRGNPLQMERLRAILDAYIGVSTGRDRDDRLDTAFQFAQVIQESSVMAAIAATAAWGAISDPAIATLLRQEQDQVREVEALYGVLQNAVNLPSEKRPAGLIPTIRSRIQDTEKALADLRRQVGADSSDVDFSPIPIAEVRRVLLPNEALILIEQSAADSYIWGVSATGSTQFASSEQGLEQISKTVDHLRKALAPTNVATADDIPPFDVVRAHELYRQLLEPVREAWKGAETLFIVSGGKLATLPFTLLPTSPAETQGKGNALLFAEYRNVSWLVRDRSVAQLPTVQALASLRAVARSTREYAFAGFGDPIFSEDPDTSKGPATRGTAFTLNLRSRPSTLNTGSASVNSLPRLPDTGEEIARIADVLGAQNARDVHLGLAASESRVRKLSESGQLAAYRIVSFATHGLRAGDLDGLAEPALAMTNPKILGEADDGFLTMSEIFHLSLNADLAILSACNTAAGEDGSSEAVSGLGRAFFYAGARAVLLSNWPVFSPSTLDLMVSMFGHQDGSLSQAYRTGITQLIDAGTFLNTAGQPVFAYAHPLFWAPFSLVGDATGTLRPEG